MESATQVEKGHGRVEKRTAYTMENIEWLGQRKDWKKLSCVGAIHIEFTTKKGHFK